MHLQYKELKAKREGNFAFYNGETVKTAHFRIVRRGIKPIPSILLFRLMQLDAGGLDPLVDLAGVHIAQGRSLLFRLGLRVASPLGANLA
jgi:hypothetical protein